MLLHNIRKRFRGWMKINRDIRTLRAFDNYLLADVGIARQDIADCVKGKCEP